MQWIKVFTNIFANTKMQLLLKERDGDTFFRIWIQLLVIAGISAVLVVANGSYTGICTSYVPV